MDCVDSTKKSPLHLCCKEGHTSLVEHLLLKGFRPNARDRTLKTPLHIACYYGNSTCADCLLKNGADIMTKDS